MNPPVHLDDPVSVALELAEPWGKVVIGGSKLGLICPLCVAWIPLVYSDASKIDGDRSPKQRHIDNHMAIANLLKRALR